MKSNLWLNRQLKDPYVKKAKNSGFLSRAAYKLIEIENKYKFISKSNNILELGSSPGSWSQVICNTNKNSLVDAFDLIEMKYSNKNINFYNEDFLKFNFKLINKKYDLILSDLSPNKTGHKQTDHLKIILLINTILDILNIVAKKNSHFVFKFFPGTEEKELINSLKKKFIKIERFKPKSSRKNSSEIYIVALNFLYN